MVRRSTSTSASKAKAMRSGSGSAETPKLKAGRTGAVSGKTPSTAGQKGTARDRSTSPRKSTSGYSAPGHSGGYKLESAPKLGTSSVVSTSTGKTFGTAAARNNSQAGASGATVSGKSESYGTAPAKSAVPASRPYGT